MSQRGLGDPWAPSEEDKLDEEESRRQGGWRGELRAGEQGESCGRRRTGDRGWEQRRAPLGCLGARAELRWRSSCGEEVRTYVWKHLWTPTCSAQRRPWSKERRQCMPEDRAVRTPREGPLGEWVGAGPGTCQPAGQEPCGRTWVCLLPGG
jgi:hypothetical protein